jgi:hypothetical protein
MRVKRQREREEQLLYMAQNSMKDDVLTKFIENAACQMSNLDNLCDSCFGSKDLLDAEDVEQALSKLEQDIGQIRDETIIQFSCQERNPGPGLLESSLDAGCGSYFFRFVPRKQGASGGDTLQQPRVSIWRMTEIRADEHPDVVGFIQSRQEVGNLYPTEEDGLRRLWSKYNRHLVTCERYDNMDDFLVIARKLFTVGFDYKPVTPKAFTAREDRGSGRNQQRSPFVQNLRQELTPEQKQRLLSSNGNLFMN